MTVKTLAGYHFEAVSDRSACQHVAFLRQYGNQAESFALIRRADGRYRAAVLEYEAEMDGYEAVVWQHVQDGETLIAVY